MINFPFNPLKRFGFLLCVCVCWRKRGLRERGVCSLKSKAPGMLLAVAEPAHSTQSSRRKPMNFCLLQVWAIRGLQRHIFSSKA